MKTSARTMRPLDDAALCITLVLAVSAAHQPEPTTQPSIATTQPSYWLNPAGGEHIAYLPISIISGNHASYRQGITVLRSTGGITGAAC